MRSPLLIGSIVVLGLVASIVAQQTPATRSPRNAAEFDELFKRVSNWGRWARTLLMSKMLLLLRPTGERA